MADETPKVTPTAAAADLLASGKALAGATQTKVTETTTNAVDALKGHANATHDKVANATANALESAKSAVKPAEKVEEKKVEKVEEKEEKVEEGGDGVVGGLVKKAQSLFK